MCEVIVVLEVELDVVNCDGVMFLIVVVFFGYMEMVEMLIDEGVDVN